MNTSTLIRISAQLIPMPYSSQQEGGERGPGIFRNTEQAQWLTKLPSLEHVGGRWNAGLLIETLI